jgi:hypothetical protein
MAAAGASAAAAAIQFSFKFFQPQQELAYFRPP